jgi:DNA repair exonuclease SbcCD ATPase subunit
MITLQKLTWSNCFSYGPDNLLDLNSNTVTQIIGTNGMGKSSIPLIIEEALYNKNSKGIKKADIPNRYINSGYNIQLEFSKDSNEYKIIVDRKTNIKVQLLENGIDISSHTATNTYKAIQSIVGIDFRTFSQLVYQNTNTSLQFLTATDTNRKKFLIDLLHLEIYVTFFELFKEAARESVANLASIEAKIATIEKWLTDNKLEDTTLLPMLNLEISTEEDEERFRQLTKEIENISEKNKKILKNNRFKDLLSNINIKEIQNLPQIIPQSYDSYQKELGEITAATVGSKRLLDKLNKLGDHCPTCEQTVDSAFKQSLIDAEARKVAEARDKEDEINQRIQEIKRDNQEYDRRLAVQEEWEEVYRSIDRSLPASTLDQGELQDRLDAVRGRLQEARSRMEETAKENERRTRQNTRIEVILEQTEQFDNELGELKEQLTGQLEISSNLEVLKKAFSTNGLVAYKIENLVKELEDLTNAYLGELSDGRFTLEFVVQNDKLNVQITDNGNQVDIQALSSGELARVNTATLIAIRKLMSSISKSRINVLFLDEVINVLDEVGREKLIEVLLGEELNTYIVSHGWSHPLLDKVEISKHNNISRLEQG